MTKGSQESSENLFQMGELAARSGVSTQTVQYYTMLGLIQEVSATEGGRRLFDSECVKRVKLIHRLNKSGYTLRDIREMFLQGTRSRKH